MFQKTKKIIKYFRYEVDNWSSKVLTRIGLTPNLLARFVQIQEHFKYWADAKIYRDELRSGPRIIFLFDQVQFAVFLNNYTDIQSP